jgi:DNA-binding NtrC family response regulator
MDTILLQQSDSVVLEVATMILENQFNIVPFEHFPVNLAPVIESYAPKLAIIDFILDGKEAIAYLKEIRKFDLTLPVLALSCNSNIATAAKINGFNGYICKPFDVESLVNIVKNYNNKFHQQRSVIKNAEIFNHSY